MDVTRPPEISGVAQDDAESADSAPLDLTPRDVRPRRKASRKQRRLAAAVLVVVVAALGVVLFEGLTNATVFFYNVDQAVAKRPELGTSRFRIQGNVIPGSVHDEGDAMAFDLKYHGVEVHVVHTGDVPDLFKPSIPVVLEGHFDGKIYRSDQMLLRHSPQYDAQHKTRDRQADQDAKKSS
jgi:cytochrome c-type biogenesis protein CcmE